jgi:hypothetical protein
VSEAKRVDVRQRVLSKYSKRTALSYWALISAALLAVLLVPLYIHWDKIAARPDLFVIIFGGLGLALFQWAKISLQGAKRINTLFEEQS